MASNPLHTPTVVLIKFPFYWEQHNLEDNLLSASTIEYVVTEDKPLEQIVEDDAIYFCGNDDWIVKTAKEIINDGSGNTDAPGEQLYVYEVWNNVHDYRLQMALERGWITHQLAVSNADILLDLLLVRKRVVCDYSIDVSIN